MPLSLRRPILLLARLLLVLAVVVVGLAGGTAYRLTRGPIALPAWMVAQVEARAERGLAPATLEIGEIALAWDGAARALRLGAFDLALARDGAALVTLPEARVTVDGANLLRGRVRPREVDLAGLALNVARDAEGRFSLQLGAGGGALPRDPAEALALLDAALAAPAIAELDSVRVSGITLRLSDAITGLAQDVTDGTLALRRDGAAVALTLDTRLPVGPGRAAGLSLRLTRGERATAEASLDGLPLGYLAEILPGVPALRLARGEVSLRAGGEIGADGRLGPLSGRAELRDAILVDRPDLRLDRATLALDWEPGSDRIMLSEIAAGSPELSLRGAGQVILEDGATGPVQLQLRLGETVLDPEGVFERRVAFDQGVITARLTQTPLALRIGQAMLTGPSGTARLSGRVAFAPGGLEGGVRLEVPEMPVEDLKALWPPDLRPGARRWFVTNMIGGTATDAVGALRFAPGRPPDVQASFAYREGQVRFMRHMPPAEQASGAAQFDGRRLAMRVDAAAIPARGPDVDVTAETPRLLIASADFVILDATEQPLRAEFEMRAGGEIGDILTLLDNRPLRLLERVSRDRSLATGRGEAVVRVALPLRDGNAPADIDWSVRAILRDVESDKVVPGRRLAAQMLTMTADPEAVEIGGAMTFEGIPFEGSWRQPLPPRSTEPIVPGAPPGPPGPPAGPGRVAGTARVAPEDLARLGIDLGAFDLSGRTAAQLEVTLEPGAPPRLSLTSDLTGLAVGLPAISWSKPAGRAAAFALDAVLGSAPEVTRVALDAPGLSASGRVSLRPGGGLDQAQFQAVDTGWFRGPLTLTGRGADASPRISIGGGEADLRRALLVGGDGGGGEGSPLDIALDRLTITEGIALTGLRANLRGGAGEFTAAINGGTAIEGVLAPQQGGTALQVQGGDAGGVLRSAGLFRDARGGRLQLTLRPTGQQGVYDGALRIADLRVRNAPALASLLQTLSVVGILEQLTGEGLAFTTVESDFTLRPGDIVVRRASAVGPSMSITADGTYDLAAKTMDLEGVVSPIYLVNGLFGAFFSRRDEGLFGFTYRLRGRAETPEVEVNPLSILTPGVFREIFRRPPPGE
ncbi:AsmA-like C-terminal region-containing protein [Jannaschia seohaensis]|uniref:AsmA-like C-terminal region n=1 Tax=Jannaschia seohaensis TaxID=475081 RepID=A0A2Y9C3C9_9RHOB|nr:AsmA-like C-terminal region-containing protein [Jannaschia seohaensis]PWJ12139.1 AsmA-like protein [Jannaschia seohaensis]SSA51242.1 AsmA-like C-terminal region [Jannaschia seohaensis]